MRLSEIALQLRGLVARGVVKKSVDTGESQTVDLKVYAGHEPTEVEVLQPFGFASYPPANSVVVLLAVGGDQGDYVALPAGAPGIRLGRLEEGESALYTLDGSRVHAKKDGTIHVLSSKRVLVQVGDTEIDVTAELIRARIGTGETAPRVAVTPDMVKLRIQNDWIVVQDGLIVSSRPIVTGDDPDPSI